MAFARMLRPSAPGLARRGSLHDSDPRPEKASTAPVGIPCATVKHDLVVEHEAVFRLEPYRVLTLGDRALKGRDGKACRWWSHPVGLQLSAVVAHDQAGGGEREQRRLPEVGGEPGGKQALHVLTVQSSEDVGEEGHAAGTATAVGRTHALQYDALGRTLAEELVGVTRKRLIGARQDELSTRVALRAGAVLDGVHSHGRTATGGRRAQLPREIGQAPAIGIVGVPLQNDRAGVCQRPAHASEELWVQGRGAAQYGVPGRWRSRVAHATIMLDCPE